MKCPPTGQIVALALRPCADLAPTGEEDQTKTLPARFYNNNKTNLHGVLLQYYDTVLNS